MTDWAFDDNLFEIAAPEDLDLEAFQDAMQRRTFACIRGLVSPRSMYEAHERIVANFDRRKDHPATGQPPEAVRTNFQKINLGGESRSASNDDARFFRAFYNPLWAEDVWGLRAGFTQLARMRNRLAGLAPTSRSIASKTTACGPPHASTSTRRAADSSGAIPTTWSRRWPTRSPRASTRWC